MIGCRVVKECAISDKHEHVSEGTARRLQAFRDNSPSLSAEAMEIAALLAAKAPYALRMLGHWPGAIESLAQSIEPRDGSDLRAALDYDAAADVAQFDRGLRKLRAIELARLAVVELAGNRFSEVGEGLSALADTCLDAALRFHYDRLIEKHGSLEIESLSAPPHLCAIAMGKLGGRELNFCSDIDLILVYPSDDGQVGALSLNQFFSRLASAASKSLAQVTDNDLVFRVDHRLRPEGESGPLTNSMPAIERYYATWGRFWERLAWLKARPCAGDLATGKQAISMLQSFVYSSNHNVVEEINALHRKVVTQSRAMRHIDAGFDVKVGAGGIRQIEFFVQSLQLLYGRHKKSLRVASTREALGQLLALGHLTSREYGDLHNAYDRLRHFEHILQLDAGRQTQRLPNDDSQMADFVSRLDMTSEAFATELESIREAVTTIFASLGIDDAKDDRITRLLVTPADAPGMPEQLTALGFHEPDSTLRFFGSAQRVPNSLFSLDASPSQLRLAEAIITECLSSPDADNALRGFCRMVTRRRTWKPIARLLGSSASTVRQLATAFGASDYIAKQCYESANVLDWLAAPSTLSDWRSKWAQSAPDFEALEEYWHALARFRHTSVLQVALSDIAGALPPELVCDNLTQIAETSLEAALALVRHHAHKRYGALQTEDGTPAELTVLGLGKLGGRELGYASDLDVVFIHNAAAAPSHKTDVVTILSRTVQRLMNGLKALHPAGRIYDVDTRLRPSGSQGLLVSTLNSWRRYHTGKAELWEQQALTKLRVVGGSRDLGQEAVSIASDYVYSQRRDRNVLGNYISDMRARIELERSGKATNLKTSAGGIVDIEFATQYLQLLHGGAHPHVRTSNTTKALHALRALAPIDTEAATRFYWGMRRAELRLHLAADNGVGELHDGKVGERLARSLGYPDFASFETQVRAQMTEIREMFQTVFAPLNR